MQNPKIITDKVKVSAPPPSRHSIKVTKPILEIRASSLDKGKNPEIEHKYIEDLKIKYKALTNDQYHIIVLLDDCSRLTDSELVKYPKLTVL